MADPNEQSTTEGKTSCLAVIPARGGSKGLPGKNIRPLLGRPMIAYSIEAALKSGCVDEVFVSTDSEDIAAAARAAGGTVPLLRPAELASDEAKSIDVLRHAVEEHEKRTSRRVEHVLLLQPTSPLRNAEDVRRAYAQFVHSGADSLQSVALAETHPYLLRVMDAEGSMRNYLEADSHLRRQELDGLYRLNGAIYLMKRDLLMTECRIVGERNQGFIMDRERSVDIDDLWDFRMAEWVLKELEQGAGRGENEDDDRPAF